MVWFKHNKLITILVRFVERCDDTIKNKNYINYARKILANNIVYFRLKKNWSQEDFAEKLGTTTTYVSNLENARRNLRIDYIGHIADVLSVPLEQLFIERDTIENHRIPRR